MTTASASYTIEEQTAAAEAEGYGGTSLVQVEDHCEDGKAKLLYQFADSTKLRDLLCTYLDQTQDLEAAFWQLLTLRGLDVAEGVNLDALGALVGQDRLGDASDDDYRSLIRARIRANRSRGTAEDLIDVLRLVLGSDEGIVWEENYPASASISYLGGVLPYDAELVWLLLRLAKPAGVSLAFVFLYTDPEETFTLSETSSFVAGSDDQGWGNTANPATGGQLSSTVDL